MTQISVRKTYFKKVEGSQAKRDIGMLRALCFGARHNRRGCSSLEVVSKWPTVNAWDGGSNWLLGHGVTPTWVWSEGCDGTWFLSVDPCIVGILLKGGEWLHMDSFGNPVGHGVFPPRDVSTWRRFLKERVIMKGYFGKPKQTYFYSWPSLEPEMRTT